MSSFIGRNGRLELVLAAGQVLSAASYGPGNAKISQAGFVNNGLNPIYAVQAILNNSAVYLTYAAATNVLIEAANGCELEYEVGTQPALTFNPFAVANGLTAKAGGGQSGATALTGNINRVTTVASAADSLLLPAAVVGRRVSAFNATANSMTIYPQSGEAIGTGSANAGQACGAGKGIIFECAVAGTWNYTLSA